MHQRLRKPLEAVQGQSGADPDDRVIRLDLGGFLVGFIGFAIVALTVERGAFAIPGVKIAAIHAQRVFVGLQRLGVLLLFEQRIALLALLARAGGIGTNGLLAGGRIALIDRWGDGRRRRVGDTTGG